MNNAMVATLVGLSMYAVAACEKAVDESARNGAQGPQVSFKRRTRTATGASRAKKRSQCRAWTSREWIRTATSR